MAQDVRTNDRLLVNSGQYDHKLSRHIINTAMTAGGDDNEEWRADLLSVKKQLRVKLQEIGLFSTKLEADKVMSRADLAPEDGNAGQSLQ